MKKATRLLILTAFVFPLFTVSRAYAGGPGPGQRINFGERERLGIDPIGGQAQGNDLFNNDGRTLDGFHATDPDNNPLHLQDPIGDPVPDMDRNDLFQHSPLDDRDHHLGGDPSDNGGGTAPLDGGISLLLAAGIGLGIKKARARKQTV
ncbi:MAG TPA: hypothetical protein VL978_02510 [Puia sp.]|nr:hypothetical protein [Puia sp.]